MEIPSSSLIFLALLAWIIGFVVAKREIRWKRQLSELNHHKPPKQQLKIWGDEQGVVYSRDSLKIGRHVDRQKLKATNPLDDKETMTLVVRDDLGMSKGKAAAQCCHAAFGLSIHATSPHFPSMVSGELDSKKYLDLFVDWWNRGAPMDVYSIDSEEGLYELSEKAKGQGYKTIVIRDAGRTQIKSGSRTVLGVSPGNVDLGELKMY